MKLFLFSDEFCFAVLFCVDQCLHFFVRGFMEQRKHDQHNNELIKRSSQSIVINKNGIRLLNILF